MEVSQQSFNYQEQRKCLKASLIMHHRPDLLGELMDLKPPEGEDVENLKAFHEQIQKREKIAVETVWQVLDGSFSGDKQTMKQLSCSKRYIYITESPPKI